MRLSATVLFVSSLLASAHPGEQHGEEGKKLLLARREHQASAARGLEACQQKRAYRDLQSRAIERRAASANVHRKAKRTDQSGVGHNLTDSHTDIKADSDDATVFGDSHVCILDPEGDVGPYFVKGELIRSNVRESQAGVPIILDGQFINVETCEPIQGLYWDIWNCNATGVYSGVVANGNGNTDDATNVDSTFLRGIQETDSDGVAQFLSIFPGHYNGRATHHHLVAWIGATMLPNNTLTSGYAAHIGQVFWDQDLINKVEATAPYASNTASIVENVDDGILGSEVANTDSDPFLNYVYLGNSLEDGLLGWITIGINTSANYSPSYSFEYTENGGVALDGTGNMNGGGGGPGTGSTATTTVSSTTSEASATTSSNSGPSTTTWNAISSMSSVTLLVTVSGLFVGWVMFAL